MIIGKINTVSILITLLSIFGVQGCGSSVDKEYKGEPLAIIKGDLRSQLEFSNDEMLKVAILWVKSSSVEEVNEEIEEGQLQFKTVTELEFMTEPVEIEATFPASFTLNFYEPPSQDCYAVSTDINGINRMCLGYPIVYRGEFSRENIIGIYDELRLAYIENEATVIDLEDIWHQDVSTGFLFLNEVGFDTEEGTRYLECTMDYQDAQRCGRADRYEIISDELQEVCKQEFFEEYPLGEFWEYDFEDEWRFVRGCYAYQPQRVFETEAVSVSMELSENAYEGSDLEYYELAVRDGIVAEL